MLPASARSTSKNLWKIYRKIRNLWEDYGKSMEKSMSQPHQLTKSTNGRHTGRASSVVEMKGTSGMAAGVVSETWRNQGNIIYTSSILYTMLETRFLEVARPKTSCHVSIFLKVARPHTSCHVSIFLKVCIPHTSCHVSIFLKVCRPHTSCHVSIFLKVSRPHTSCHVSIFLKVARPKKKTTQKNR